MVSEMQNQVTKNLQLHHQITNSSVMFILLQLLFVVLVNEMHYLVNSFNGIHFNTFGNIVYSINYAKL